MNTATRTPSRKYPEAARLLNEYIAAAYHCLQGYRKLGDRDMARIHRSNLLVLLMVRRAARRGF